MLNNHPLVSVFIPYYNDKGFLKNSIEAVLNQSYQNFELILFNHASTDGSRTIAHSFDDKRIIHIDAETNLGAGSGYNIKISLPKMRGKYVKLLCADDVLKFDALEVLVKCLEQNPNKDIVFADMDYVDEKLNSLNTKWSKEVQFVDFVSNEKETLLKFFRGYSHIAYPAAMIRMSALYDIKIDTTLIMLFDVSLWIKLLIAGKKICYLNKSTVDYRISSSQLSSASNIKKAIKIGYFELFQLLNIYYDIKDINLIKFICPCPYSKLLKKGDEKFIPFVISYFLATTVTKDRVSFFKDQQSVREIFGNTKLYEIIQDEGIRESIKRKFKFDIKDFRNIYSYMPPKSNSPKGMQKILLKQAEKLNLIQIILLFMYKIIKLFSKQYWAKKLSKTKNKYTV